MRSLNYKEVELLQNEMESLTKGQLQWAKLLIDKFQLGFWMSPGLVVLEFLFKPKALPFMWIIDAQSANKAKSVKKPISTFIEKHFSQAILEKVAYEPDHGRKISFHFSEQKIIAFEFVPNSPNISAIANGKTVYMQKPIERPVSTYRLEAGAKVRTFDQLQREYSAHSILKKIIKKPTVKKKDSAQIILEIQHGIEKRKKENWGDFALWLQTHAETTSIPKEFNGLWHSGLSWIQNIQAAYDKDKKNSEKIEASLIRIKELTSGDSQDFKKPVKKVSLPDFKGKTQFFTIELQKDLLLLIGKSAKDNLSLLRKARPWDIWFHIKDLPGSHGVVFINKGATTYEKHLKDICQPLLEKSFKGRAEKMKGIKCEIIYTEVRFVQPLKGDKLGRVTVRNEKTYLHLFA